MSWFQRTFDPNTAAYNDKIGAANRKQLTLAMAENNVYRNKGVAFRQAQQAAGIDKSVADSNVKAAAMRNQYAAFQGFEECARTRAQRSGPTGMGTDQAERGRTASYMALLAKRQDIEHGLRESFGAAYHQQLHQNAVRKQNQLMKARDALGMVPKQRRLEGMRKTNTLTAAFNIAKTGAQIYAGIATMGAAKGNLGEMLKGFSQIGDAPLFKNQSSYYG